MSPSRAFVTCIGIGLLACGCSSPPKAATPEEAAYLRTIDEEPLDFTLLLYELDTAVDRTLDWLHEHEDMQLSAGDRAAFKEAIHTQETGVIRCPLRYHVSELGSHGYEVLFSIQGGTVRVRVSPEHEGGFGLGDAMRRNARILAHYIRTGKEMAGLVGT